jgi:hypothetical protein
MLLPLPRLTVALQTLCSSVREQCCQYIVHHNALRHSWVHHSWWHASLNFVWTMSSSCRVGCGGLSMAPPAASALLCVHCACLLRQELFYCDGIWASCKSLSTCTRHTLCRACCLCSGCDDTLGVLIIELFIPRCSHCWGLMPHARRCQRITYLFATAELK